MVWTGVISIARSCPKTSNVLLTALQPCNGPGSIVRSHTILRSSSISARLAKHGRDLVTLLNTKAPAHVEYVPLTAGFKLPPEGDIVVNATSIGLYPDVDGQLDINLAILHDRMLVANGIHNTPDTHLIRIARPKGCEVLDGLSMLVNVCAICIDHWTGIAV
jgi:shikimate dehydrogenase